MPVRPISYDRKKRFSFMLFSHLKWAGPSRLRTSRRCVRVEPSIRGMVGKCWLRWRVSSGIRGRTERRATWGECGGGGGIFAELVDVVDAADEGGDGLREDVSERLMDGENFIPDGVGISSERFHSEKRHTEETVKSWGPNFRRGTVLASGADSWRGTARPARASGLTNSRRFFGFPILMMNGLSTMPMGFEILAMEQLH